MSLILLGNLVIMGSLSFSDIYWYSSFGGVIIFLPLFLVWFTTLLAETNRTPFDFAEGESELVSGFNTEYSGVRFALIFIAEYLNIIVISLFTGVLFFPLFPLGIFRDLLLVFYALFLSFVFI